MGRIPIPFAGWRGRVFVLKTATIKMEWGGPRASVVRSLREQLPAMREVAVRQGDSALIQMLDQEISALGQA